MTRVKFCGMTQTQDVLKAVALGADALGFVFYQKSPRSVTIERAQTLTACVPAFITRVGLFVNSSVREVRQVFKLAKLNLVQYHGDETPAYCETVGLPFIKALRMKQGMDVASEIARYPLASGFLLDTHVKGVPGGTGERFDWDLIPQIDRPIILAGGLTPENAWEAIAQAAPWALDVSGGIESKPGHKDPDKMGRFIQACKF